MKDQYLIVQEDVMFTIYLRECFLTIRGDLNKWNKNERWILHEIEPEIRRSKRWLERKESWEIKS